MHRAKLGALMLHRQSRTCVRAAQKCILAQLPAPCIFGSSRWT